MDSLPPLGTRIPSVLPATFAVYSPLLLANSAAIKSTPVKTHSYGPHPRQQLDIYTPSAPSPGQPVLLFFHGGGFVRGSKNLPVAGGGLVYANLAHFFAETYGFTVVVPDYRLVGQHEARFPSGGEDVALAVEWVAKELTVEGETRRAFLMGNSAGGAHVTTFLLHPGFASTRSKITKQAGESGLRLGGVVELSVPFDLREADESRKEVLEAYHGTREDQERDCPLGLLESARSRMAELEGVPVLVATTELDPRDEVLDPTQRFMETWTEGAKPETLFIVGHNHISVAIALGTGVEREEKWGHDVGRWIQSKA